MFSLKLFICIGCVHIKVPEIEYTQDLDHLNRVGGSRYADNS